MVYLFQKNIINSYCAETGPCILDTESSLSNPHLSPLEKGENKNIIIHAININKEISDSVCWNKFLIEVMFELEKGNVLVIRCMFFHAKN